MSFEEGFQTPSFTNGFELVNGVGMHAEIPENFQVPQRVLKKYV